MTVDRQRAERSRDLERLLTFVDAIAAVAITLLVLPLANIAGQIHSSHDSVWEVMKTHSGRFWAFGLSFLVIARLWLSQHEVMRAVIASNAAVVRWLMIWSLAIVFLPFPTALLPDGGEQSITKVLYIGTLFVCSLCLTLLSHTIGTNRSLRDSAAAPDMLAGSISMVLLLVALVLTLAIPALSYFPLFLLFFSDLIEAPLRRRLNRRSAPGPTAGDQEA